MMTEANADWLHSEIREIVVVGGGVAGSTVASLLARSGRNVWMFDRATGIDPLVGESLLPAAVPILQQLGVEDALSEIAVVKPGIAFVLRDGRTLSLSLERLRGMTCTYAYNVRRPQFDDLLRARAANCGVRIIRGRAEIYAENGRALLDAQSLDACGLNHPPDLIIDCGGRAQVLRRGLRLGGTTGRRHDTCLFAHYHDVDLGFPIPGYAVITALHAGWCWRIPLPDRMSVGVIMDSTSLRSYGDTPDARLDHALRNDPIMANAMLRARRITDVQTFRNYQWKAERFFGPNWVLVGDAAGFVDPTLSPGVLLALQSSVTFAETIVRGGVDYQKAMLRWEAACRRRLDAWEELVECFYDGSLFAMIMQGEEFSNEMKWMGVLNRHIEKRVAGALLGAKTTSPYTRWLIRFLINHAIVRYQPPDWAIR